MLNEVLQKVYFGNTGKSYLIFVGLFIAGIVVLKLIQKVVLKSLRKWAAKTDTVIDDFLIEEVDRDFMPLLFYGVFYISMHQMVLSAAVKRGVFVLGMIFMVFFLARFIMAFVSFALENYWMKDENDPSKQQAFIGIRTVLKLVVWSLAVIILMDNLGIKITTLVAGLGIGGVAIALAGQAILGDLFSYFTIFFDKPFQIGDFIIIGDYLGVVEYIGIKTTRIRSLWGEQVIFSNTDLTSSRVKNYKRMEKRRVAFKVGVTYQTSLERVKEIPGLVRKVIEQVPDTVFDRAHFFAYGDFSLVYEIVYYVLSPDYNKYMDTQQEINFKIKEEFEKRKIEFAYPTQTVFVTK